jgi:hypothetical protein
MTRFVILVLAICLFGCERRVEKAMNVEFILPDSYQGAFKVIEDKSVGSEIEPIGGELSIEVPESGIVRLKDLRNLREWHKPRARYAGGAFIPFGVGQLSNEESVAFFSLWTNASGEIYYFVGTEKDFQTIQSGSPFDVLNYLPNGD